MAKTQFGVVHSTASNLILRVVHPEDDAYFDHVQANLADGEALTLMPIAGSSVAGKGALISGATIQTPAADVATLATLQAAIGTPSHSGRCVVIDASGKVINIIIAEPTLFSMPGYTVMQNDTAQIGWTYAGGAFAAPAKAVVK